MVYSMFVPLYLWRMYVIDLILLLLLSLLLLLLPWLLLLLLSLLLLLLHAVAIIVVVVVVAVECLRSYKPAWYLYASLIFTHCVLSL